MCLVDWHVSIEFWQPQHMFVKALHCIQVVYEVQLENGVIVRVVLYLVYAVASNQCCQTDMAFQQRGQADMHDGFQWNLVTRSG